MAIDSEIIKRLQEIAASMGETEEQEYEVGYIVVEEGSVFDAAFSQMAKNTGSHLIEEHETYKKFGNSPVMTYRIDKGDGTPGRQTHVHVFMKGQQLYAINMDGSPHDGSKAKLSKKSIETLKALGVTPPEDGLLEWIEKNMERKQLLCD